MSDIRRLTFTELFERLQSELMRDATASEATYKGRINDIYMFDLPAAIDYVHIKKTASVTTTADYSTGTITDISATTATGSGTSWTSAISNNMLLKLDTYDEIYRVTYSSGTALTLDRTWVGTAVASDSLTYTLYQDRYALASDYSRMILDMDRAVYYWSSGSKVYLTYKDPDEFGEFHTSTPGCPSYYTIKWVNGDPYIYIMPPDTDAMTLYYEYIPSFARMAEYTTGTITTLANAGTAVTGNGTAFTGFVTDTTTYDYYFRIDDNGTGAESVWYKIASAGSATALTLSDAYGGTSIAAGTEAFTIATVSLLPAGLDLGILYTAAVMCALDQGNASQADRFAALAERHVAQYKSLENKTNYGKQRLSSIYSKSGVRK